MKKSFILITLIAVLTASVALACAADNLDCPYLYRFHRMGTCIRVL